MNTTRHFSGRASPARAAAAGAVLLLSSTAAAAQSLPDTNISNTASLGFGRFVAASGGAISLDINGARTRTGGVVLLASAATPASFSIGSQANDNKVYVLTLPSNGSVTLASGPNSMAVNDFVSNYSAGAPLPSGTYTVMVGATLQVSPSQAPGAYSGNFNVTLEYQ